MKYSLNIYSLLLPFPRYDIFAPLDKTLKNTAYFQYGKVGHQLQEGKIIFDANSEIPIIDISSEFEGKQIKRKKAGTCLAKEHKLA